MFWSTLVLAIPALALAAAVWGVLRRKWYGVLPLLAVVVVGWSWQESWWLTGKEFLDACTNQSAVSEVMMLLLAAGTAVMALAALWAGWSRGWWFWRAVVFSAVPASLVPLEANELILLCLMAMPVLAATAWFLRNRGDQMSSQRSGDERTKTQKQFSLANLFLAFIVLGILANALRSILVGHIILADWGLLWLAASIVTAALTAASPVLARDSGRKWLIFWSAAAAIGVASWWWLGWNSDPLGLALYFRRGPRVAVPLNLIEGELCFLAVIGLLCCTYTSVENLPQHQTNVRMARVILSLLVLGIVAPLALIYSRLLPPPSSMLAPLPPSKDYELIQRAAFRIRDLERHSHTRNQLLAVFNELDRELVRPGHVTHDAAALAREHLAANNSDGPIVGYVTNEMGLEILRAVHDKRDADAIRLARLQWRVGQTFYLGGTMGDYFFGFNSNTHFACSAIVAEAPWLSEQECRKLLKEARALETSEPDYETLCQFNDYWLSASTGWRDRLHDSAAWLTGAKNQNYQRLTQATFEDSRKRPLASLRTVQYVLALELYRREHGRFPDDLSTVRATYDLPEFIDPYSSLAPVYRRTNAGFLLYSVGFDSKDDGGNFPPPYTSVRADSLGLDINLVSAREDLVDLWRIVMKNIAPTMPPAPPPAPKPAATK